MVFPPALKYLAGTSTSSAPSNDSTETLEGKSETSCTCEPESTMGAVPGPAPLRQKARAARAARSPSSARGARWQPGPVRRPRSRNVRQAAGRRPLLSPPTRWNTDVSATFRDTGESRVSTGAWSTTTSRLGDTASSSSSASVTGPRRRAGSDVRSSMELLEMSQQDAPSAQVSAAQGPPEVSEARPCAVATPASATPRLPPATSGKRRRRPHGNAGSQPEDERRRRLTGDAHWSDNPELRRVGGPRQPGPA